MANMNIKRTIPLRSPPDFNKFIKEIQARKFQEQKRLVPTSRILLGMLNQYKQHPLLVEQLFKADFK